MYDYVIAGAGSAGCVLANRLTQDPTVKVLLIEAGKRDRSLNIKIPAAFAKQFRTKLDWDFNTEPEPHCNGRSLYMPRGKGLGGSGSMNAMLYVRGRPLDYDQWESAGAPGWGWKDVWPYFLRAEDNERGASEHHAVGGPLRVENERSPRELSGRFLAACRTAGIPVIDDYNGLEQDGASMAQVTQRGGRRWSPADAYLRPAMKRANLEVLTGAQVLGVELEGTHARGVRYLDRRGSAQVALAERDVILAAGALVSPQLLMLSGIGPADQLREHGISVAVDLPGVGENLQDHPYVSCVWDIPGGGSLADAEKPKAVLEYLLRKSGPLSSSVAEALAFVRSRPGLPAADLQFHFAPAYFVDNGFAEYDGHAITMGPALISPQSRGWVRLRSADPTAKPRILTNTLSESEDVAALIAGARLTREIAACEPLSSVVGRELFPGATLADEEDLIEDLRRRVDLLYHPVGTCRMGSDDDAVVDPELRVRGIDGLRVVDASIMPVIPGANTNAPTIMVAERASDLIIGAGTLATISSLGSSQTRSESTGS
jgi:choline dehydrogenase